MYYYTIIIYFHTIINNYYCNYSKPISEIAGKRIALFSFGSGLCSSFYSITIQPGVKLDTLISHLLHIPEMLEKRQCISTSEYDALMENRELAYNKGRKY